MLDEYLSVNKYIGNVNRYRKCSLRMIYCGVHLIKNSYKLMKILKIVLKKLNCHWLFVIFT